MARGGDEVEESVDTVVPEARVTLNTRLFSQDIIVLTLEISNDFLETVRCNVLVRFERGGRGASNLRRLVVNVVAKPRGVNDGQGNANAVFLEF